MNVSVDRGHGMLSHFPQPVQNGAHWVAEHTPSAKRVGEVALSTFKTVATAVPKYGVMGYVVSTYPISSSVALFLGYPVFYWMDAQACAEIEKLDSEGYTPSADQLLSVMQRMKHTMSFGSNLSTFGLVLAVTTIAFTILSDDIDPDILELKIRILVACGALYWFVSQKMKEAQTYMKGVQAYTEANRIGSQIEQDLDFLSTHLRFEDKKLLKEFLKKEEMDFSSDRKKAYICKRQGWLLEGGMEWLQQGGDFSDVDWYLPVCRIAVLEELKAASTLPEQIPPSLRKHGIEIDTLRTQYQQLNDEQKAKLQEACLKTDDEQVEADIAAIHHTITQVAYPLQTRCAPLFKEMVDVADRNYALSTFNILALLQQQWQRLKDFKGELFYTLPPPEPQS